MRKILGWFILFVLCAGPFIAACIYKFGVIKTILMWGGLALFVLLLYYGIALVSEASKKY